MRGRVMALYAMVLIGGTPIGAPLLGALAQTWGARWVLWGGGILTVVSIGLVVLIISRIKHLDLSWQQANVRYWR